MLDTPDFGEVTAIVFDALDKAGVPKVTDMEQSSETRKLTKCVNLAGSQVTQYVT